MLHYPMRKNPQQAQSRELNITSNKRHSLDSITKKIKNYIFNLKDVIGKGSFSTVYLGHHQTTFEKVAIKVIELKKIQSQALNDLLDSEIQTIQSLHHPNMLNCYDVYFSATNCYIITEHCNGGDLKEKIKNEGPFNEESVAPIIKQVYQGLKYLSKRNIIHRDFKTSNVFINNGQIKIADFGFAKKIRQNFRDITIGSPLYMSPEGLIDNIYGPKTDVWAFGIFIYELLHENNPFYECQTKEELKKAIIDPLKIDSLRKELSKDLKQLIIDCVQIDHQKRISIEQIEFTSYFNRIKQRFNTHKSIQRISSEHSQKYGSGVSTEVPIKNTYRYLNHHKTLTRNESTSHNNIKPNRSKDSHQYGKSINNYDLSYKTISPRKKELKPFSKNIDLLNNAQQPKDRIVSNNYLRSRSFNYNNDYQLFSKTFAVSPCFKTKQSNDVIFTNVTQFRDLVTILHYCRFLFKTLKLCEKLNKINVDYLTSWMMQVLTNLIDNIKAIQNPFSNIIQLQMISLQYQLRYNSEVIVLSKQPSDTKKIKQKLTQSLRLLKFEQLQKDEIIKHFIFLYELTDKFQEAVQTRNFKKFSQNNKIEEFLITKSLNEFLVK